MDSPIVLVLLNVHVKPSGPLQALDSSEVSDGLLERMETEMQQLIELTTKLSPA